MQIFRSKEVFGKIAVATETLIVSFWVNRAQDAQTFYIVLFTY